MSRDLSTWYCLIACALTLIVAWRGSFKSIRKPMMALSAIGCMIMLTLLPGPWPKDTELANALPPRQDNQGFISSNNCQSCHPGEHTSWHKSYHRTMTTVPSTKTVKAPFDGRVLKQEDEAYIVEQKGDAFWVHQVKLDAPDKDNIISSWRVVLLTGSHHLQAFWIRNKTSNKLEQFWWVYLIRQNMWIPNEDSFLQPGSDQGHELGDFWWSESCVFCHTTGQIEPQYLGLNRPNETVVAELGVACESCHGPATDHVAINQSPGRRYLQHHKLQKRKKTIFNPATTDKARSASACGRCHSVTPMSTGGTTDGKLTFRPGDLMDEHFDLKRLRAIFDRAKTNYNKRDLTREEADVLGSFWPDYTVRVSGREYTGMVESTCFSKGEMTCTTCHSLHQSEPNKQLHPKKNGDQPCLSCHQDVAKNIQAHTHHKPNSPGNQCINCHMPYTSYGLLKTSRSHRVDSPTASGNTTNDKPNACNLCHMDQTLQWTQDKLHAWYKQPKRDLRKVHQETAAGLVWMIQGDAPQRAIAVWHLGYKPTQQASNTQALVPGLLPLFDDPYAAIRHLAGTALGQLEGYDSISPKMGLLSDPQIANLQKEVEATYRKKRQQNKAEPRPTLLQRPNGRIDDVRYNALYRTRDDRLTWISE